MIVGNSTPLTLFPYLWNRGTLFTCYLRTSELGRSLCRRVGDHSRSGLSTAEPWKRAGGPAQITLPTADRLFEVPRVPRPHRLAPAHTASAGTGAGACSRSEVNSASVDTARRQPAHHAPPGGVPGHRAGRVELHTKTTWQRGSELAEGVMTTYSTQAPGQCYQIQVPKPQPVSSDSTGPPRGPEQSLHKAPVILITDSLCKRQGTSSWHSWAWTGDTGLLSVMGIPQVPGRGAKYTAKGPSWAAVQPAATRSLLELRPPENTPGCREHRLEVSLPSPTKD